MNIYITPELAYFMKVGELVAQYRYDEDIIDRYKKAIDYMVWEHKSKWTPRFFRYNLEKRLHILFDKLSTFLVPLNINFDPISYPSPKCFGCLDVSDDNSGCDEEGKQINIVAICISHYKDREFFDWNMKSFLKYKKIFHNHFGQLTNKIPLEDILFEFNNNYIDIRNYTQGSSCEYNFYYFTWKEGDLKYQRKEDLRQLLEDYGMNYDSSYFTTSKIME